MGTKMKGLLKGLRYISQIFEGEDKEPEMEIGFPTDVKHVAHIGWDGPSVNNAPSWMTEYKSAPLGATNGGEGTEVEPPKFPSAEFQPTGEPPKPKQSRQKDSSSSDQPVRDPSKPSRRRPSSGSVNVDIQPRETSEGSRRGRRSKSNNTGGGGGPDSPTSTQQDSSGIPKQSRRRKTKGSNSGGSSRSSRTKSLENGPDDRSATEPPSSSKPEREEEEGCLV
uniref:Desiccation-associated protein n=1 Tax=Lilium longiflorum TaxID=4690 RepID=Q71KW4_LILLO|nr:desiccation-associated protein [Lilium longiflorum]ABC88422.1 LLP12-2 [Lilium longiflorum]